MKIKNIKSLILAGFVSCGLAATLATFTSCENGDKEYDDYVYQTVYFAQQTPVRTITLGEDDVYPNDLDNAHQCELQVVVGGVWKNRSDRHVKIAVDNSLVSGLSFSQINGADFSNTGNAVEAMPSSYYTLSSTDVTIPAGEVRGKVTVQLTDAFFADPKSAEVTYVIPVRIVSAEDSILEDKDYTLYAVTYKNTWGGRWINTTDGTGNTIVTLNTLALNQVGYPHTASVTANGAEQTLSCNVIMTVADNGSVTFSTDSQGCSVTGNGTYTVHGAKADTSKKWGDKDRDQMQLQYAITYTYTDGGETKTLTQNYNETLVMQTRGNLLQTFTTK